MAVKINNIEYSGFFYNGEALTAMYLNGNKVFSKSVIPPIKYKTYRQVEWISNEDLANNNIFVWLNLGYQWNTKSKVVFEMQEVNSNGSQYWGTSGGVSDNADMRFFRASSTLYMDVGSKRIQISNTKNSNFHVGECGNYYFTFNGSTMTGTTYTNTDTSVIQSPIGLFCSAKYKDSARFKYFQIYEDDELIMDIVPVLDENDIPMFLDKISGKEFAYMVDGHPSTGLTAGRVYDDYSSDYIEGDGSDYIDIGYVPVANTYIEMDNQTDSMLSCGSYDNQRYGLYWQRDNDTSGYWRYSNGAANIPFTSLPSTRYTVKFGKQYYIDGGLKGSLSNSWYGVSLSITVFGIHRPSSVTERTGGKLYGLKIYEGDELKKNFIPYKQSGVVGLYDTISNTFYPSNSNTIAQGGDIIPQYEPIIISNLRAVKISNDNIEFVAIGETKNLNASTEPNTTLTYTSSNPSVASVDSNGVISGVAEGSTTITITAQGYYDEENEIIYQTTTKQLEVECNNNTNSVEVLSTEVIDSSYDDNLHVTMNSSHANGSYYMFIIEASGNFTYTYNKKPAGTGSEILQFESLMSEDFYTENPQGYDTAIDQYWSENYNGNYNDPEAAQITVTGLPKGKYMLRFYVPSYKGTWGYTRRAMHGFFTIS
jgi:hypothetical protein